MGHALDSLERIGRPTLQLAPLRVSKALKEDKKRMLQIDTWRVSHAEGQSLVAKKSPPKSTILKKNHRLLLDPIRVVLGTPSWGLRCVSRRHLH